MKTLKLNPLVALLAALLLHPLDLAAALGTSFIYEGRLTDTAIPPNPLSGQYDFQFELYTADSVGERVGVALEKLNRQVASGVFAVELDFGPSAFGDDPRWLEIKVRPAGVGDYSPLSPRQKLVPVAYSLFAAKAGTLTSPIAEGLLPTGVAKLGANQTFTGQNAFSNPGNSFTGDGSGLTGLNSTQLTGPLTLSADPQWLGGYDTSGAAHGVAVAGNYAYVADWGQGLQVIDISNPANPQRVGGYDFGPSGYASDVAVAGNYAYLTDGSMGLHVINISDPAHPQPAGRYIPPAVEIWGVTVVGAFAYVAHSVGLEVIDIHDPANPVRVGRHDTDGSAYDVAVAGDFACVAEQGDGIEVFNISVPGSPQLIAGYNTSGSANGVALVGDKAYVADSSGGLQVIDIDPDPWGNLHRVGDYDTAGTAYGVTVAGRYAFVADGATGLEVIDINDVQAPPRCQFGEGRRRTLKANGLSLVWEGFLERSSGRVTCQKVLRK